MNRRKNIIKIIVAVLSIALIALLFFLAPKNAAVPAESVSPYFHGPSGPPHINGPSGPPPGY